MKKSLALLIAIIMLFSLAACGGAESEPKNEKAEKVMSLIEDIGTVSLDSENAIVRAEEAYAELSDDDKKEVETYDNLVKAREEYDALVVAAEEQAKREEAIAEVEALIAEITAVDLENADKIDAAKDAYDALPDEDKAKIEKGSELSGMAETVKALKEEKGKELLSKMRVDEDKVRGLSFYYPSAWKFYSDGYWAADQRCFVLPYIGEQNGTYWMRLVFNYTDDDWVFFEKITIAADDERFYEYFSYYDVTRDNGGGDVWEYVDMEVGASEIEMLWAIANSEETIIRFEGDDYYRDFTVSASDKQSIKAALEAYEAVA